MADTPFYDPMGIDPNSLIPWLTQVFQIVAQNEPTIQDALKNHTAYQLNHSLFGADASGLGLSLPGTDPNSRQLFDPYGLGEDSPLYAFNHLALSPTQRQGLYNNVLGQSTDPFLKGLGMEFFHLNPDDLNSYWNASTGASSGFNPALGHFDPNAAGLYSSAPGAPAPPAPPPLPTYPVQHPSVPDQGIDPNLMFNVLRKHKKITPGRIATPTF